MRWDFMQWCEMFGIPLPGFWFPPGWKIEPDRFMDDESEEIDGESNDLANKDETNADRESKLRANQKAKIACQQIAEHLWKELPEINIANMVEHDFIQKYGGGAHYENETVRSWIQDLAPSNIKGKRGRPKKK